MPAARTNKQKAEQKIFQMFSEQLQDILTVVRSQAERLAVLEERMITATADQVILARMINDVAKSRFYLEGSGPDIDRQRYGSELTAITTLANGLSMLADEGKGEDSELEALYKATKAVSA